MQAVGLKNPNSLLSFYVFALVIRGSLSFGTGGHVRRSTDGSLSFGISKKVVGDEIGDGDNEGFHEESRLIRNYSQP